MTTRTGGAPGPVATALLALDVAVLPPAACQPRLAELNAALDAPPHGFRFDDTHLPHVTLAQQFVPAERLDDIVASLARVVGCAAALRLRSTGLSRGRTTSSLRLAPTVALAGLHAAVMDALLPFVAGPGDESAFLSDGEPPRAADLEWVTCFRNRAAHARYDPHITLGVGAAPGEAAALDTVAERVALCHLGRYCTCRRLLAEWALTARGA